jgi:transcriptional regulator with XRE-family HTH domain
MENLRQIRELSGLSQIALARRASISRARLQLAESGDLTLKPEERESINRALRDALAEHVTKVEGALVGTGT